MSQTKMPEYDPCNYETYVGEPERCAGCNWNGDPEQEGEWTEDGEWLCETCVDEVEADEMTMAAVWQYLEEKRRK